MTDNTVQKEANLTDLIMAAALGAVLLVLICLGIFLIGAAVASR